MLKQRKKEYLTSLFEGWLWWHQLSVMGRLGSMWRRGSGGCGHRFLPSSFYKLHPLVEKFVPLNQSYRNWIRLRMRSSWLKAWSSRSVTTWRFIPTIDGATRRSPNIPSAKPSIPRASISTKAKLRRRRSYPKPISSRLWSVGIDRIRSCSRRDILLLSRFVEFFNSRVYEIPLFNIGQALTDVTVSFLRCFRVFWAFRKQTYDTASISS